MTGATPTRDDDLHWSRRASNEHTGCVVIATAESVSLTHATTSQTHQIVMTKRKRTPPPSPPPRKCVMFEVPQSLWKFQAIARELARQSELLQQQIANSQDENSGSAHRHPPGAPNFDALTFQNNPLRFSPYSHQPFLPSQPWPQAGKRLSASSDTDSDVDPSTTTLAMPRAEASLQEGAGRQTSVGPDDQLFDELNDALNAEEAGNMHGRGPSSQYLRGGSRITFDPHLSTNWNGMRQETYPPITQNYPQMNHQISQHSISCTPGHQSTQMNNLTLLPSSPANPPPPPFSYPKPPPPTTVTHTKSSIPGIPGYYKSSLKLWSQEGHNNPPAALSRPVHQFSPVNNSYPQIPYAGSTTYPPPAQQLASSPVTSYTNYERNR
jgi:hypothetical protein